MCEDDRKNRQVCLIIALCILEVNRQIEDFKRGQALSPQYEIQLSIDVNDLLILEITSERLALCMRIVMKVGLFCHVAAESLIL